MLNYGETALPYEPYNQLWRVRSGALIRNPKNLVPAIDGTRTQNGITFVRSGGVIKLSGTLLANKAAEQTFRVPVLEVGKTYAYSLNATSYANGVRGVVQKRDREGKFVANVGQDTGNGFVFTVTEDMYKDGGYVETNIYMAKSVDTAYDFTCYPVLNEGDTPEPFYVQD